MPQFFITFRQDDDKRRNCYTTLDAVDKNDAIERAYQIYGNQWAFAYDEEAAKTSVTPYGLTYIAPGT